MLSILQKKINCFLDFLSKHTQTDMVYLVSGGYWLTLEQVVANTASFVLAIVFAKFISQSTYGTYSYLHSILGILTLFALPGISTAIRQSVARGYEQSFIPAFKIKMIWSLVGSLTSTSFGIYYYFGHNPSLAIIFLLIAVFFPIMYPTFIYDAFLQGKKLFRLAAIYEIIYQTINTLVLVITVLLTDNLVIIFLSFILVLSVTRLTYFKMTLKKFPPNKKTDPKTLVYGKHISFINVLETVASYFDRLLVFYFLGPVQLAIYSFAILPIDKLGSLFTNIPVLALPKFSRLSLGQINHRLFKRITQLFFLSGSLTIGYILLAPLFFRVFFPRYISSIFLSQLFAITFIFKLPTLLLTSLMQSKITLFPKKIMYISSVLPQVFLIVILFIFGKLSGVMGIIWSRIIFSIVFVMVGLLNWKILKRIYSPQTV